MKNKFCISPFLGINVSAIGDITVCCANQERIAHLDDDIDWNNFLNSEKWNDVKLNVAAGTNRYCSGCIKKELSGSSSRRLTINRNRHKTFLDIDLGNVCNLWCAMCESYYSSKWYSIDKDSILHNIRGGKLTKPFQITKKHLDIIGKIYPEIESCNLKGGEPLYYKNLDYLFKLLVDKKCLHLNIITNLTLLDDSIFEYLKKIDHVSFLVSVDGLGEVGNWIRYDKVSSSEIVLKNIEKLKLNGCSVDVLTCPQVYNFYHLPDFLTEMNRVFTKENSLSIKNIIVDRPLEINKLIPDDHKKSVIADLKSKKVNYRLEHLENLITYTNRPSQINKYYQDLFIDYTTELNKLKTIDIWNYIPLLRDELNVQNK